MHEDFAESEVRYFYFGIVCIRLEENVLRFDVQVQDIAHVQRVQTCRHTMVVVVVMMVMAMV